MRKLAITVITSAILFLTSLNAYALTGPNTASTSTGINFTPRHEAACRGFGPFCPPGYVRACGPFRCWCRPCR
jgi:hypothetical protein